MEGDLNTMGAFIGAGLACIGMGGAAIGVGHVAGNYLSGALRNPLGGAFANCDALHWHCVRRSVRHFLFPRCASLDVRIVTRALDLRTPTALERHGGRTGATETADLDHAMSTESEIEAAEKAGIPQLDFSAFPNQIFWLVVCLVILYLILSRVALPRIEGILEHRKKRIQADILDAEALNNEALELRERNVKRLDEARAKAESIMAAARSDIRELQETALADVGTRIHAQTADAEARLDEIRKSAPENVAEVAHSAALEIVSSMMPGRDTASMVSSAVNARTGAPRK